MKVIGWCAAALLLASVALLVRPTAPRLRIDGDPAQPLVLAGHGTPRLTVRLSRGDSVEILSVQAQPESSVHILDHPGACVARRKLSIQLPVCTLWLEPGGSPTTEPSTVTITFHESSAAPPEQLVMRVRSRPPPG
jgi:hypothetical protein